MAEEITNATEMAGLKCFDVSFKLKVLEEAKIPHEMGVGGNHAVIVRMPVLNRPFLITPHAQCERGKVIDRGVHIYIYVCSRKKNLNRTLEIDSPFQTLTVGLLVEFID